MDTLNSITEFQNKQVTLPNKHAPIKMVRKYEKQNLYEPKQKEN